MYIHFCESMAVKIWVEIGALYIAMYIIFLGLDDELLDNIW